MTNWNEYLGYSATPSDGSGEIKVFCPELIPVRVGTTSIKEETFATSLVDQTDKAKTVKIKVTESIICKFFGFAHNISIPDVVVGEPIRVFQYGGSDDFYWLPYLHGPHLRTTEHLRLAVAARETAGQEPTIDESYGLELNSRTKRVVLWTSAANGEVNEYLLTIDAAAGTIHLIDDAGQRVTIDSGKERIVLQNGSGTKVDLHGGNLAISAEKVTINKTFTITDGNTEVTGPVTFKGKVTFAVKPAGDRT